MSAGLTCRICRERLDRAATRVGFWHADGEWVESGSTRTHPSCQTGVTVHGQQARPASPRRAA